MKILVVSESRSVWGAEESLIRLLASATESGIAASVAVTSESPLTSRLHVLTVPTFSMRFAELPALRTSGSWSTASKSAKLRTALNVFVAGVKHSLTVRKYDAVLVFSVWQGPEMIVASRISRRPIVLDIHETFSSPGGTRMASLIARACDGALSPSVHLLRRMGLPQDPRFTAIPRPFDPPISIPPRVERTAEDRPIIGIFGQIAEHKQVHVLLSAVEAAGPRVEFLIVGGQAEPLKRSEYENEIRRRVDRISHASVVDRVDDTYQLMSACDYVVNCSDHEAFGRTILEATISGAIPIVLNGSGPAEVVRETGIGHVLQGPEALYEWATKVAVPMPHASYQHAGRAYAAAVVAPQYWGAVKRLAGSDS